MNAETTTPRRFVVLCLDDEPEVRETLLRDMEAIWGGILEVEGCGDAREALERCETLAREHAHLPLILADHILPGMSGIELVTTLHGRDAFRATRKLLLSSRTTMEELTQALNQGALNGNLPKPWDRAALREITSRLITEYFVDHAPQELDRLGELVDVSRLSRALVASEHHRHAMGQELKRLQRSFLADRFMSDDEVDRLMIDEFDKALGSPERVSLPAGTLFLKEGQDVEQITLLIEGQVRLTREIHDQEILFHSASVGRVIGLLALAHGDRATFTCKAVSEVVVIPITLEQLEQALQTSPALSLHFVTVLLRSMVRRNRRAMELQVEIGALLRKLERERDQLARTLHELKATQLRLVESEKMATLGQMAAGIGHELNNPVAAIKRSAEFLREDIDRLAEGHPDRETFLERLHAALDHRPVSTREQRALRQQMLPVVGDRQRAQRLVKIGITDPAAWQESCGRLAEDKREQRLAELEHYYQLGASLKNILSCSERIVSLVQSMRAYSRSASDMIENVDLHLGLEETLLLFAHDLRAVEVERDFGDLPRVTARPGELNQVWTNLVSNAIQVMPEPGRLIVRTDSPDPLHVRVRIIDNGPGIPADNQARIFDVNFTTRQGLTGFGLGIGLPICQDIVHRHGGQIEVQSEPGCTTFSVMLPVRQEHDTSRPLP